MTQPPLSPPITAARSLMRPLLSFWHWRAWRDFFLHHGLWAPGVRWLRRWSVRRKMLLMLVIVSVPLGAMTISHIIDQDRAVAQAQRRLQGAQLAQAGYELAGAMAEPATGTTQKLQALVLAHEEALAAGLPDSTEWATLAPQLQRLMNPASLAAATRAELSTEAVATLERLREGVLNTSGLTTLDDPALASAVALAFNQLPALQSDAAALAALGAQIDAAAAAAPERRAALRVQAAGLLATLSRTTGRAEVNLALLRSARGALAVALPAQLEATRMLTRRTQAWLQTPEPAAEAAAAASAAGLAPVARVATDELKTLRLQLHSAVVQALQAQRDAADQRRMAQSVALTTALLVSVYLGYCFYLVMSGGLLALNQQTRALAEGDLTRRPRPLGRDEVAETMGLMSESLARLSDLLASVRDGVGAVSQASQQVAQGNADLSNRNRSASASLEQLVQGVGGYSEQLEACGRQVETVVGVVQALRLEAAHNRKQMLRLRERLHSLQGKSREIAEIVRLIDGIAFRTNILALNASVEASKAGESGRGFMVVAQEVRSLALRTADSARRAADIVSRSTEDIEHSGALADDTGRSIESADVHVNQIHTAMNDVATLTRNGETDSARLLEEITQLKDATEQNLNLVEQLANASVAMRSQGERLTHKVGQFKLS